MTDRATLAANDPTGPSIWAIGGGKGGVGKSCVTANLAVHLAHRGYRVCLVDGDLGGANLHTLFGAERPKSTLHDFFSRRVANLEDLAEPTTVAGLSLVAGDADTLGSANPQYAQKQKLIRHLRRLPCNAVLLDLGAGTSLNTLDLFLAADIRVVVTVPEPTAVQNCFGFLKAASLRALERETGQKQRERVDGAIGSTSETRSILERSARLVVNRARPSEGRRVHQILVDMVRRFLGGGQLRLAGVVHEDPVMRAAINVMKPLAEHAPRSPASSDLDAIVERLLAPVESSRSSTQIGLNEEISVDGVSVHVQTEDLGEAQAAIRTQVFLADGQVVLSRRTPYVDVFFERLSAAAQDRPRLHHVAIKRALATGRVRIAQIRRSA